MLPDSFFARLSQDLKRALRLSAQQAAGNMPARAGRMLALPRRKPLIALVSRKFNDAINVRCGYATISLRRR